MQTQCKDSSVDTWLYAARAVNHQCPVTRPLALGAAGGWQCHRHSPRQRCLRLRLRLHRLRFLLHHWEPRRLRPRLVAVPAVSVTSRNNNPLKHRSARWAAHDHSDSTWLLSTIHFTLSSGSSPCSLVMFNLYRFRRRPANCDSAMLCIPCSCNELFLYRGARAHGVSSMEHSWRRTMNHARVNLGWLHFKHNGQVSQQRLLEGFACKGSLAIVKVSLRSFSFSCACCPWWRARLHTWRLLNALL